jgi:hypothetical protein
MTHPTPNTPHNPGAGNHAPTPAFPTTTVDNPPQDGKHHHQWNMLSDPHTDRGQGSISTKQRPPKPQLFLLSPPKLVGNTQ